MRPVQVQVRKAAAQRVLCLAEEHGARAPVALDVRLAAGRDDAGGGWSLLLVNLPNDRFGRFVTAVGDEVTDATFTLMPVGALPISTPLHELDERIRDVSRLSTMEVVVASLQSVGAWRGMLVYSALAGVVGAYGLIFDVVYLLVAAMLINPMGAPAVVAVIGVAIGDRRMFGRGGLRFLVSLAVQAASALALGLAYGLSVSTGAMEQVTSLSAWSALLALAAGAAGAHTQLKSERDSLVSGTAAGFMVAAALAPPAAVLGLSIALARWDYTGLMAFLLLLQFVAISAGGWLVLHLAGVRPGDATTGRGSATWRTLLAAALSVAVIGMVVLQSQLRPRFVKADLAGTAVEIVRDVVATTSGAALIESSARFTRPQLARRPGEALLVEVLVESTGTSRNAELETEIREQVSRALQSRMSGVVPFIRVDILPGP